MPRTTLLQDLAATGTRSPAVYMQVVVAMGTARKPDIARKLLLDGCCSGERTALPGYRVSPSNSVMNGYIHLIECHRVTD